MIYFIEVDEQGNLLSANSDGHRTMVPLVNVHKWHYKGEDGKMTEHLSKNGKPASHYGHAMLPPIEVDQPTFELVHGRLEQFYWDGEKVIKARGLIQ